MYEKYKQRIIRFEELLAIQTIWDRKGINNTSVKDIWNEVYGINQKSPVKDFDEELMLVELCKKNDVPYQMIKNMLIDERDMSKYTRRKNIFIRLENHLEEHMKESNANS